MAQLKLMGAPMHLGTEMTEEQLAQAYRKHASNLREAAAFDRNFNSSGALRRIAIDYEDTAEALEGLFVTNRLMQERRSVLGISRFLQVRRA
jgi:hypothetical protein